MGGNGQNFVKPLLYNSVTNHSISHFHFEFWVTRSNVKQKTILNSDCMAYSKKNTVGCLFASKYEANGRNLGIDTICL